MPSNNLQICILFKSKILIYLLKKRQNFNAHQVFFFYLRVLLLTHNVDKAYMKNIHYWRPMLG